MTDTRTTEVCAYCLAPAGGGCCPDYTGATWEITARALRAFRSRRTTPIASPPGERWRNRPVTTVWLPGDGPAARAPRALPAPPVRAALPWGTSAYTTFMFARSWEPGELPAPPALLWAFGPTTAATPSSEGPRGEDRATAAAVDALLADQTRVTRWPLPATAHPERKETPT